MVCNKCGNELKEGAMFCDKCGKKVKGNNETKKGKRLPIIIILIIILLAILFGVIFINNNNNSNSNFNSVSTANSKIEHGELIKILKNKDDGSGIYLQENTANIGTVIDVDYNNYNNLISYICTYTKENATLNEGGLMLFNYKTRNSQIINLPNDFSSLIYYFSNAKDDENTKYIMQTIMDYIYEYGEEIQNNINTEQYMEMGKKIGQKAGIELCRNITKQIYASLPLEEIYLYRPTEIFFRYRGIYMPEQQYVWTGIDESMVNYLLTYNKEAYNTLVFQYGQPYQMVNKFEVYDAINISDEPKVTYNSLEEAKKGLGVQEYFETEINTENIINYEIIDSSLILTQELSDKIDALRDKDSSNYEQVVDIIGFEGTVISSNTISQYEWKDKLGNRITVFFYPDGCVMDSLFYGTN